MTRSPPALFSVASETLNLPARSSARYKCSFVPRHFFNSSLFPLSPFALLHGPFMPQALTEPTFPCRYRSCLAVDDLRLLVSSCVL